MLTRILFKMALAATLLLPVIAVSSPKKSDVAQRYQGYAGSKSCQECHEKFYGLWSTSRHGLAMQPYTPEFAEDPAHAPGRATW